jgi:hypothetical protein
MKSVEKRKNAKYSRDVNEGLFLGRVQESRDMLQASFLSRDAIAAQTEELLARMRVFDKRANELTDEQKKWA